MEHSQIKDFPFCTWPNKRLSVLTDAPFNSVFFLSLGQHLLGQPTMYGIKTQGTKIKIEELITGFLNRCSG